MRLRAATPEERMNYPMVVAVWSGIAGDGKDVTVFFTRGEVTDLRADLGRLPKWDD